MKARVLTLLLLLSGCASSHLDAPHLSRALAPTFANLIVVQEPILGGPPLSASALRAEASCQKVAAPGDTTGAGTYRCTVRWVLPGHGPVEDAYEVSLGTDACFTATADSTESHLGGPTLRTRRGETVTNLLYAFDGCFDPS